MTFDNIHRPSDHMKTWQWSRSTNWSGTAMSHDHLSSQTPSYIFTRYHERGGTKKRYSGRHKRWEDNIKEWTGLEFSNSHSQRAVENRKRYREMVAKSSVVPQRWSLWVGLEGIGSYLYFYTNYSIYIMGKVKWMTFTGFRLDNEGSKTKPFAW